MGKLIVIQKAIVEKYWDNYIEKALSHKYIRKIPNGKGGWNYIYPSDFSKPMKVLLSIFGLKEEKIDDAYNKQNIQAEYGADKKTFASHVLEYLSNRATWNKFFHDKFNRDRYKTPVKFEPKKSELKTKVENGEIKNNGKTTDKTGKEHNETKEKDFKAKWNNSLMRKIYSMYNPIPEDKKTETVAGPVAFNVGDSVSKDGKVGKITKDYGNGMYFVNFDNGGMGRFNAVELQNLNPTNQEVSDAADVNAVEQEVEQNRNDVLSENPSNEISDKPGYSDVEKIVIALAYKKEKNFDPSLSDYAYYEKIKGKMPELAEKGELYSTMLEVKDMMLNDSRFQAAKEYLENMKKDNDTKVAELQENTAKINEFQNNFNMQLSGDATSYLLRNMGVDTMAALTNHMNEFKEKITPFTLNNLDETIEVWNEKIKKEKHPLVRMYRTVERDYFESLKNQESEQEEHENRSEAMMGNDNAKKYDSVIKEVLKDHESTLNNIRTSYDEKKKNYVLANETFPALIRILTQLAEKTSNTVEEGAEKLGLFIESLRNNVPENEKNLIMNDYDTKKLIELTWNPKNHGNTISMLGNQNAKKDGVPKGNKPAVNVPKADDIYTLYKDDKFKDWKIKIKGGHTYEVRNGGTNDPDRTIYVSNQAEGEKILKNLKKNSLEALQKKGLTAESVTNNIDYDKLIADAENDKEKILQKVKDLREAHTQFDKTKYATVSDAMDVVSNKHSEIRQQIEDLKKQYNRVRLAEKKTEISLKISKLNTQLDDAKKQLDEARKNWRDVFDESRKMRDEFRRIEDNDIKYQDIIINYLKKAKEAKGIAVKDLTDQDKIKKIYDMLNSTTQGGLNYVLRCTKDDVKVGDKLYYVNPYDMTVQECVIKEVDSKGDEYGWEKGVTFVNKVGNGYKYGKTFMSYDRLCSSMVHADGSVVGKPIDYSEKDITKPVINNDEYQEYLNRHNAMLGNDNAKKDGPEVEETNTNETVKVENQPQTESEMKEEQKKTEKAREKAGLKKPGKNYGERVSAMEDAISLNPNAENYAYKDTGYIAGSQREKIQDFWKRKNESGEGTSVEEIDWNTLEENPRYAEKQITKENILGDVDYEEMFKNKGVKPYVAYLASRVFAAISKVPEGHTVESRKNYVIAINTIKDRLADCKSISDVKAVVDDIYGEATQTYDSQILRDPKVKEANTQLATFRQKSNDVRISVMEWARNELIPKYKEKGKKERTAIRNYKNDIQKELDAKIRESDPNFEGNAYFTFDPSDKWWPVNIDNQNIFKEEKEKAREELKEVRKNAKEEVAKITTTADVWKELGKKFVELRYSNAFQTNAEKLKVYENERTFTDKNGNVLEKYDYKYRDKTFDRFETWDWLERKRIVKPKSEIIDGRVKRRFELIVPETLERVGGRNVSVKSTEELKKAFNFRDIQTGSYVQSDPVSAKWHVDNLAAGFADLCDVLGIKDDQVSLNGRLALAVGARGHGKALAHYEPVERVINITKMRGGGSLGHEWFHSFDNMIAEAMNGGNVSVYMSDPRQQTKNVRLVDAFKPNAYHDEIPAGELNQKVKEKFDNLVKAMREGDTPETELITYKAEDVEEAQKLFSSDKRIYSYYGDNFYSNLQNSKSLDEAIKVINARYKSSVDLIRANSDKIAKMGKYEQKRLKDTVKSFEKYRKLAVAYFDNKEDKSSGGEGLVLTGRTVSRFYEDAKSLDGDREKPYWSTAIEMAARGFEAYLVDKLAEKGRKNDYLSGHADNTEYQGAFFPYPTERDRVKINKAFDELFEVIRSENAIRKAIDILDNFIQKSVEPRFIIKGGRFLIRK